MIVKTAHGKQYEVVIGLEVHAQIATKTKLFSRSGTKFACEPNSNVSFVDVATPGTLPVLNMEAIELAIKFGIAIDGYINTFSRFDRKHYFYPDLPMGYQITQFYKPLITNAKIDITLDDGSTKIIEIERVHIEQDAGKLIHDRLPNMSCVDYNRAGIPLMEIVSKPQISSPNEAVKYLKSLHEILRFTGTSDADMEKGSFRCDANVSVRPLGQQDLGKRCEIKNINSFKFVAKAIDFEAKRQVDLIEDRKEVIQQTRLFNADSGTTVAMRTKEDADDYYYFPDPDLLPIRIDSAFIDSIKKSLPELPRAKHARYVRLFGLSAKEAEDIISNPIYCEYFEFLVQQHNPKFVLGWVMTEMLGRLNKMGIEMNQSSVSKEDLKDLLDIQKNGTISSKMAKEILDEALKTKQKIQTIILQKDLKQIDNDEEIKLIVQSIIQDNPEKVSQYRSGRDKLLGFFIGQAMQKTMGKANPQKLNKITIDLLSEEK